MTDTFDAIVVGGGPAGSTVSTLIAKQGHRVLLLERDRFPRYQIGESLLPSTVHGICELLGVGGEMERAGFVRKAGGTFRWGKSPDAWTFGFERLGYLAPEKRFAYQVERAKFDDILLRNAQRHGVDVREEHRVTRPIVENGRVVGAAYEDSAGKQQTARARFVVDASGNQTSIAQNVGERVYSKFFQNIALFGYYEGAKRLPTRPGNILCAAFNEGWFWFIPLSDTLTSVGAVVAREHADKLKGDPETSMNAFIEACPLIKEYLAPAKRVTTGMYGQLRIRKDYSYSHSKFWTKGAVLVGDAACFIDPVFSSGVHLATYSAMMCARSINTVLAGALDEERCFVEFEKRYRREFQRFYDFLMSFYDMNRDEDSYFWQARSVLATEERANEAFIRLVSGLSDVSEPAFPFKEDFVRRVRVLSEDAERRAQLLATHVPIDGSGGEEKYPTLDAVSEYYEQRAKLPPEEQRALESSDIGLESAHVTRLAEAAEAAGDAAEPEVPLFEGGLVPTVDGLHWREHTA